MPKTDLIEISLAYPIWKSYGFYGFQDHEVAFRAKIRFQHAVWMHSAEIDALFRLKQYAGEPFLKLYVARAADEVPNLGPDVSSAYGYSNECSMARILCDGKVYKILEGATNIMKIIIATDALGIKKANR